VRAAVGQQATLLGQHGPWVLVREARRIDLLHPDARLVHGEELLDQVAEVDSAVGLEEEDELVAVELVLDVQDDHRQPANGDLVANDAQGILLVLNLVSDLQALRHAGHAQEPLALVVSGEEAPAAVACRGHGIFELRLGNLCEHNSQVLAAVRLDTHKVSGLDAARRRRMQRKVAVRALELHLVHEAVTGDGQAFGGVVGAHGVGRLRHGEALLVHQRMLLIQHGLLLLLRRVLLRILLLRVLLVLLVLGRVLLLLLHRCEASSNKAREGRQRARLLRQTLLLHHHQLLLVVEILKLERLLLVHVELMALLIMLLLLEATGGVEAVDARERGS